MTIQQMATESDRMLEIMRRRSVERHFREFQVATIKYYALHDYDSLKVMGENLKELEQLEADMDRVYERELEICDIVKQDRESAITFLRSIEEAE